MCGICGFTRQGNESAESAGATVRSMCDVMAHRGPDGEGYFLSEGVAFGHRRLSLIDLEGAAQPMARDGEKDAASVIPNPSTGMLEEAKRFTVVFNGEIYNYQDLKAELVELGYSFNRASDTEVLLCAYIEWGKDCLAKLRGMFAFAIWDAAEKRLFAARDYFGIKPLYFAQVDGELVFASEIKCILKHPGYKKAVNYDALDMYLSYQYSVLDETFFAGIYKLRPAHYLVKEWGEEPAMERWWQPTYDIDDSIGVLDAARKIHEAVQESVSYHKVADVEVASFLSSGVDSNYLAASLADQQANIKTFTVGFAEAGVDAKGKADGRSYSEINYAEEAAECLGVANISHVITEEEFWDAVPKVQYHMDEPSADPAAVALWFVDREAAKHVKAVLSGEGSDELFGGYAVYQTPCENAKLAWCPKPILRLGSKVLGSLGIRGANYLHRASTPIEEQFIGNAYMFGQAEREKVLRPRFSAKDGRLVQRTDPTELTRKHYAQVQGADDITKMQYIDLNMWLVGDILLKTDKMAMAHSLESRVPFLDIGVWECARTIPWQDRVSCDETKISLRRAARMIMPKQFTEKKKLGFPVPIRVWLRQDDYREKVMGAVNSPYGKQVFNADYVQQLLDEHKSGKADNSRKIWTVYAFLVWHEQFFGNESEDAALRTA